MGIKRGERKVKMAIIALAWSTVMVCLVRVLFKGEYAAILGVVLGFGSTIILYLFAANYGVHQQEIKYLNKGEYDES